MTSPKKSLRPRHLILVLVAFAAATACASSQSNPETVPDSGSGTDSATIFDATQPNLDSTTGGQDVPSIFGDDSGGDDGTVGDSSGGNDATGGPDGSGGTDSGTDGSGGTDGGGGTEGGTATDSGTKDTGPAKDAGCVAVMVPTSTSGEGTCTFTTSSCAPGSVSGFTPTAPTPVKQSICATSEIQNYYNGCLSPTSTNATCQAATVSEPCYDCLVTPQTASAWGPLVATTNTLVQINVGGCLDLTEPCNHACAVAVNDDLQCEQKSCAANCPITTSASQDAFNTCAQNVDTCSNGCGPYFVGTECTSQITGPGTTCTQPVGSDAQFEAAFLAIAPLFCGM